MVTFENVWKPTDEAAKILGISLKQMELMTTGLIMVADRRDGGKLVNMKGIESFLQEMQKIANQLFSTVVAPEEEDPTWIKGMRAAKELSIPYEVFTDFCEKGKIKACRKTSGWRVEKKELNEFISSNQDLIKSLKIERKKRNKVFSINTPINSHTIVSSELSLSDTTKKEGENDPPPPVLPLKEKTEQELEEDHIQNIITLLMPKENSIIPPEKTGESVKEIPSIQEPEEPDSLPQESKVSYTIRARKHNGGHYCRIDDVAIGLSTNQTRIKKWITDKKVHSIEATESSKITWYIERESLRTFLEENNISVTFDNH